MKTMKSTIAKAKQLMALLAVCTAAVAAGWACRFQMNGHPGRYRTTYRFELRGGDDDW